MTTTLTDGRSLVLEGTQPGKELLIFAGVHGNEPCGVHAIKRFLTEEPWILRGRVTLVIGNPEALAEGARYLDANLNRLFKLESDVAAEEKASREYTRSRELLPFLDAADALLDIHSSQSVDAAPFVICGKAGLSLARALPFDTISYGWDVIEPGGSESYMERLSRPGMCIECGSNDSAQAEERAYRSILAFLRYYGAITGEPEAFTGQRILDAYGIYLTKQNFTPARAFADFEPVNKGTLIGTDGNEEVRASEDTLVLFVRKRENPREEAFVLCREG